MLNTLHIKTINNITFQKAIHIFETVHKFIRSKYPKKSMVYARFIKWTMKD